MDVQEARACARSIATLYRCKTPEELAGTLKAHYRAFHSDEGRRIALMQPRMIGVEDVTATFGREARKF